MSGAAGRGRHAWARAALRLLRRHLVMGIVCSIPGAAHPCSRFDPGVDPIGFSLPVLVLTWPFWMAWDLHCIVGYVAGWYRP